MNKKFIIFFLLLFSLLLVACGSSATTPSAIDVMPNPPDAVATLAPESITGEEIAYPEPDAAAEYPSPSVYEAPDGAYPEAVENVAVETSASGLLPFQITKPVYSGDIQVIGTGTPGIPLMLVNVTMVGEILSEAVIQEDGTFTFETPSLESGIRIGILLGNLEGTTWSPEDFYDSGYYGDDARVVPMVGFLYDTALVMDK